MTFHATATFHSLATRLSAIAALALIAACADGAADAPTMSWDEFKAQATQIIDGRETYVVEWDLPVTEDELRAYYDRHVAAPEQRPAQLESTVNVFEGHDDVWRNGEQLNLTYCVTNAFGDLKGRVVNEMVAAAAAWEAVANVNFVYVPAHDGDCNNGNRSVMFSVRPTDRHYACSFLPSGDACVARTLVINVPFFDSDEAHQVAPNLTTLGILRHELGHILGLRHEHIRVSSTCTEDVPYAELTPYDKESVMHYPQCGGVRTTTMSITPLDADGVNALYGPRPARPAVGMSHRCVTPHEFEVEFTVGWHKIRGPANATRYEADLLKGDHYEPIYAGPASSAKFRGKTQRRAIVRVRACNADGCSSYESASDIDNRCGLDDPL